MIVRVLRVAVIALAVGCLFALSQRVSEARGNAPVPGTSWAIGVLTMLFLVRAIVTESTRPADANLQKDLLWGLAAGGIITILSRL